MTNFSITTSSERQLAVTHWLLSAAEDRTRAGDEWERDGIALLRCGGVLSAIAVADHIVNAAAGTRDRAEVGEFLSQALLGGPVFADPTSQRYFVLVAPSVGRRPEFQRPHENVQFHGRNHLLGVPAGRLKAANRGRALPC